MWGNKAYEYKKCGVVAWLQFFRNSPGIVDSPLSDDAPTCSRACVYVDGIFSDIAVGSGCGHVEDTGVGVFRNNSVRWLLGVFSLVVYLGDWDVSNTVGVFIGAVLAGNV